MDSASKHCDAAGAGSSAGGTAAFHVLGRVSMDDCLALQRRLVYEAGGRDDGHIAVLLCEHPELITIGRAGSRGHIRLTGEQLRRRGLEVRYVSRGGGCILHSPGQLAVYPIVPLDWHGWSVGQYMQRLQQAVLEALQTLHISGTTRPGQFGIWGRSGLLGAMGVAVRRWITCHGVFLNINPLMAQYGFVDTVPAEAARGERTTMSCLVAERRRAVTMSNVRSAIIRSLAEALECDRYHLLTGHPLHIPQKRSVREPAARAS